MIAVQFCKMHGLGNDFILIEDLKDSGRDYAALAKRLCDRHTGIGADGILVVLPSHKADLRMRIVNCDGSEAEMCGNGVRCFARYAWERRLITKHEFTVETLAGIVQPQLSIEGAKVTAITIAMGKPRLERQAIPMLGSAGRVLGEELLTDAGTYKITSMFMGVPHTVVFVENAARTAIEKIGPQIERHAAFPEGTNVNFVEILNRHEIIVRTWERGAGPTLACGTGCCASVVAAWLNGLTERQVIVRLPLGELCIEYAADETVRMTGPAAYVFSGSWENY